MGIYFIYILVIASYFVYYRMIRSLIRINKNKYARLSRDDKDNLLCAIAFGFLVAPIGVIVISICFIITKMVDGIE